MAVNRDDQCKPDRSFGRRDADGENNEHHSGERFGIFAEPPEGDEVQVRGVEHEFDADEDQDGVAPGQRASQSDAEEQRGENQIVVQRNHFQIFRFSGA